MTAINRILLRVLGKPVEVIVRPYFRKIIMTIGNLADEIRASSAQFRKSLIEIKAKIETLETSLENSGRLPADVRTALDELKVLAQAHDDIVPDAEESADPDQPGDTDADVDQGEGN